MDYILKIGDQLFVYGSLKRGYWNNGRLLDSTFVTEASVTSCVLYDLGAFPGLRVSNDLMDTVYGEVYQIHSQDAIDSCDRLEGHPHFYRREVMQTSAGPAWVYVFQQDVSDRPDLLIESGTWRG